MDLDKLESQFHDAKAALLSLRDKEPKNEAERLCQWIINTDINPYSLFFDSGYAVGCLSIEGLHGVCLGILHALLDDGAMSFVSINDEPVIVMAHPSDFGGYDDGHFDFLQFIRKHDEKASLRGKTIYRVLTISPDDFIAAREAYETKQLKSCFLFDAEFLGSEEAIATYENDPRFDNEWISQVNSKQP